MKFDIHPSDTMGDYPNQISLPKKVREEAGILLGQFLQIRGKEELVLQVSNPMLPHQEVALVNSSNFDKIKGQDLDFRILDVTLGCDPEFFIFWGRKQISAATYLPFKGQIGSDGRLGELRPSYGKHEDHVVRNLQSLIKTIPRRLRRSSWAGGYPDDGSQFTYEAYSYHGRVSAGFHVHLGIPPEILNTNKAFNRAAIIHLVRCLDWYVSVPLMPLEEDHGRRLNGSSYGKPGDYRPSNITLEYRTPGAFYLRSPKLTRGLLGISLMVTEAIVSRMKTKSKGFVQLDRLTQSDLQEIMPIPSTTVIQSVLSSPDPKVANRYLEPILREMEQLPNFGIHREATHGFFSAVEKVQKPSPDLIFNWKE